MSVQSIGAAADVGLLDVLRVRFWFHQLNEMLKQKQFNIPIHLGFGHEAVAVAVDQTMGADDRLCASHRNSHYNLARSKSLEAVLAHYRLVQRTQEGGLMGSMNLAVDGTSIAYSSSILGNNMAVSTGIAMNRKLNGRPGVVFNATGDGAMEEGIFWESLIFARSHALPLVVIVENNDYSMSSTIAQRRCPVDLSKVCAGVGFGYFRANGAVLSEARAALGSARQSAGNGLPALVEMEVSTFCQHAGPTPGWPTDPMKLSIENGLLAEDSPDDPVFHVKKALGDEEFARVCGDIMKAGARG